MLTYLTLILAGLAAGALNAVAGGGTFLTFPALVWAGVPPVAANATATLAALPGYVGSTWAFRDDLRDTGRFSLPAVMLISAVGGVLGALLLLVTPPEAFSGLVPWLLAFATVVFATGPAIVAQLARRGIGAPAYAPSVALLAAVTTYGGYFNGGVGILLLAALGLVGLTDLKQMNGLKNLASVVLSLVSVAVYALAGLIAWHHALVIGTACALGGYFGAALFRRVRDPLILRGGITVIGAAMTVAFFLR